MKKLATLLSLLLLIPTLALAQTKLNAPEIILSENSFSFADPGEGVTIKYTVFSDWKTDKNLCTTTYTNGETIPFETGLGKHIVHAFAEPAQGYSGQSSDLSRKTYYILTPENALNYTPYKLVKDIATLKSGDKVIITSDENNSRAVRNKMRSNNRYSVDILIWRDMILEQSDINTAFFNVEAYEESGNNTYSFKNTNGATGAAGYLCATSNDNNFLGTATTLNDNAKATVSIDPNDFHATIKFGTQFAKNTMAFDYYGSQTNGPDKNFINCSPEEYTSTYGPVFIYVLREQQTYANPYQTSYKLPLGGPTGNVRQLALGDEHPEISYAFSEPGIVDIDENGNMTALATGTTTVTASWPNSLDWIGGSAEFTVTVNDYTLATPAITIGEDTFTLTDPNAEGSKLYYAVSKSATPTGDNWTEYTGAVPFAAVRGKYYVHAIARSTDPDLYGDSPTTTDFYYATDLEIGEYELLTDISKLKTDDLVIIATQGTFSKAIGSTQDKNNRRAADIEVWRNTVVEPDATVGIFKIAKTGEGEAAKYTFYSTNGTHKGYMQATSSSYNLLQTSASAGKGAKASINLDDDNKATVKFDGYSRNYLGFYTSGTAFSFACYANPQAYPLYIYVKHIVKAYSHPGNGKSYELTTGGKLNNTLQFDLGNHPEISYAFSEKDIVEIDADGLMTAKSVGSATVTATWEATEEWKAGSATFVVEVKKHAPEPDNTPDGNYDGSVTLTFEEIDGCDIYYITSNSEFDKDNDPTFPEGWTKLEGNTLTLDADTYGENPWVKVVYVENGDFDSAIATYEYCLAYQIYPPVITVSELDENHTCKVNVDFDPKNADHTGGHTVKYSITKDDGSVVEIDGSQLPLTLNIAEYGFRPTITAWIEDGNGNKVHSSEQTICLDGGKDTDGWTIHDMVTDASDFHDCGDGRKLSYTVYTLQIPVHTFHSTAEGLYITDNSDYENGELTCIRLEGAPSDIDHNIEIMELKGRLGKQTLDNGTSKYFMLHMDHKEGFNEAMPVCRDISLHALMLDKASADQRLDHHYVKLAKVYYDADANTLSMADADIPSANKAGQLRAPEGHTINVISDISDPYNNLPAKSGTYDIAGYPSYTSGGNGVRFVVLDADSDGGVTSGLETVENENGVYVADGNIMAPEGSRIFTLGGMTVDSANPSPGIYIVVTPDGKVAKVAVK